MEAPETRPPASNSISTNLPKLRRSGWVGGRACGWMVCGCQGGVGWGGEPSTPTRSEPPHPHTHEHLPPPQAPSAHRDELSLRKVFALPKASSRGLDSNTCRVGRVRGWVGGGERGVGGWGGRRVRGWGRERGVSCAGKCARAGGNARVCTRVRRPSSPHVCARPPPPPLPPSTPTTHLLLDGHSLHAVDPPPLCRCCSASARPRACE